MQEIQVPNSIEAECYLLGVVLQDNQIYYEIAKDLNESDFFDHNNSIIYKILGDMVLGRQKVDEFSLANYLAEHKILEKVGGMPYISSLMDYVDSLEAVHSRVDIVKRKSLRRQLITISQTIKDKAFDEAVEVEDTLALVQKKILEIASRKNTGGLVHIKDYIGDVYDKIHKISKKEIQSTGISTGYKDLDHKTHGLHPQTLTIIGARPSMGKTAFCLNIAQYIAIQEKMPVAIFSLEMSMEEVILRFFSSECDVELSWLRGGYFLKDKWPAMGKAIIRFSNADIYIDDSPVLTPVDIYSKLHRLIGQGVDIKAVFIDYLQLMSGDRGKRFESKNLEITEISRTLKAIAKEFNVAVIALSQLSRASEKRKGGDNKPKLSDLRESGAIEQDADLVLFIHRREYYERENKDVKGRAEIIIAKQRNGPLGTIELNFLDTFTKFTNRAEERHDSGPFPVKSTNKADKHHEGGPFPGAKA